MTTPTKIIANVQTGEVQEVELTGEELAAYNASLAAQQAAEVTPAQPTE
jgi:hypothetical protein